MFRVAEMLERNTQTQVLYTIGTACLAVDVIAETLTRPHHKITKALSRLIGRGLVDRREQGCFSASDAGRVMIEHGDGVPNGSPGTQTAARKPTRGTLRQRAWNVMRIQRAFTVREIAMIAASKADIGDPEKNLRKWFLGLERASYLSRSGVRDISGAPGSNGLLRYRLVSDTGPCAPVLSDTHCCIRDPNTGKDVPCHKIG